MDKSDSAKNIAPDELIQRWRSIPVAVAVDLNPRCQISPDIQRLNPAGPDHDLFGWAVTAKCSAPDFGAVVRSLEKIGPGDILVIDAGGNPGTAMIGEILGGYIKDRGATGVICDGAVRDTGALATLEGFSVYSRSRTALGPTSADKGTVNGPVSIGGRIVNAGDLIIGDDDGLACLNLKELHTLIDDAEAKLRLEDEWTKRLAAGESPNTVFGLD